MYGSKFSKISAHESDSDFRRAFLDSNFQSFFIFEFASEDESLIVGKSVKIESFRWSSSGFLVQRSIIFDFNKDSRSGINSLSMSDDSNVFSWLLFSMFNSRGALSRCLNREIVEIENIAASDIRPSISFYLNSNGFLISIIILIRSHERCVFTCTWLIIESGNQVLIWGQPRGLTF